LSIKIVIEIKCVSVNPYYFTILGTKNNMAKTNTNMAQQIYTNREQVEEYNYSNIPGQKLKYSCFTLTDNSKY
jgi:hypothetical protein